MRAIHVISFNVLYVAIVAIAVMNGFGVTDNIPVSGRTPQVAAATTTVEYQKTGDGLIDAINAQRVKYGSPQVAKVATLSDIALLRTDDMVKNSYYAHTSPVTGKDFSSLFKVTPQYSCENLLLSYSDQPEYAVMEWMKSTSGHKECLLNSEMRVAGYNTQEFLTMHDEDGIKTTYVTTLVLSSK